jgi:hemoglobin-like flavoprotein
MTPEQLALVEATVPMVEADAESFATSFYERLFELAPATRQLFPGDMATQHRKLAQGFSFLVEAVRDVPAFVDEARELGARHHRLGVRPDHYELVEEALLSALGERLGPAWDRTVRQAWQRLYRLVAETMQEGAAAAAIVGNRP